MLYESDFKAEFKAIEGLPGEDNRDYLVRMIKLVELFLFFYSLKGRTNASSKYFEKMEYMFSGATVGCFNTADCDSCYCSEVFLKEHEISDLELDEGCIPVDSRFKSGGEDLIGLKELLVIMKRALDFVDSGALRPR